VPVFHTVPDPIQVITPEVPNANARVLVLLEAKSPVLKVKLFKSSVPRLKSNVLVAPRVKFSVSCNVLAPFLIIGKSNATALFVIVCVPAVPVNDVMLVPAVKVTPEAGFVQLPLTVLVALATVPANPVKLTLLYAALLSVNVYVPVV
jgi:hypothetical protein